MSTALEAGLWGLLAGGALVVGALVDVAHRALDPRLRERSS